MGAGLDRAPGAVECCSRLLRLLAFVVFLVCACHVMAMVATDGGASLVGSSSSSAAMATGGSAPAWRSAGGRSRTAGADAFRSSERRIPKGPDPIHNSCFTSEDYNQTEWLPVESFMDRFPAVMSINMAKKYYRLQVQNCLIPRTDPPVLVLSPSAKHMWQSLIDLVVLNRMRGYCISHCIRADNLLVSTVTGRVALRESSAIDLPEKSSDFLGFEAVRVLFMELLVKEYGASVIGLLTDDIAHFLGTLGDRSNDLNGNLSGQHPALMSYEKSVALMIRIHQLLSMELRFCYLTGHENAELSVYSGLAGLYPKLSDMHPFFKSWWDHTQKTSAANMHRAPKILDPTVELGRWLSTMHRHTVLHTHSGELVHLAKTWKYTKKDVVGLLKVKCSLYLLEAVRLCKQKRL